MKLAGLALDFYDDPSHLKASFPHPEKLPDVVKVAHILTPEELDILRDEAYALVLVNEGKSLRKFAMVDAGNTLMSVLYFVKNHDKLPAEAVKVAAANLIEACNTFNLNVPMLLKVAAKSGMARSRDPVKQPLVGDEADWNKRTNLTSVQGNSDSGRVIPTANQMKTANVVDVSGLEPSVKVKKSSATRLALGDRYPLDSYADVVRAISYFDEHGKSFQPEDRHAYAVKTAARAEELGIRLSDSIARYGSTDYAPDVDAHLSNRRACATPEFHPLYNELQEKRASIEPEVFAELLSKADQAAGLHWAYDREVADPYFATFGGKSEKEKEAGWSWQGRTGDYVTEEQLIRLSRNGRPLVHKHFASDLTNAFVKDPVTIFESLPDSAKIVIARLASQEFDGLPTN